MTVTPNAMRTGAAILMFLFWAGVITWLRTGRSPAVIAGGLLTLFLVFPLYALIKPAGETDPAMRAAQGGLFAIVLFLGLLIALLVFGVRSHRPGLVWTAFVASILPLFVISCSWIAISINAFLKKS
jgi:hypothetical protein